MPRTGCAVVGGGPAGMVLGLLLARAGVEVTVLEKHRDFLRDFRGDTVHASTLTLLDELGLGEAFAALPPRWVDEIRIELDSGTVQVADLSHLPGAHQHIAFAPQWDLLDLLARAGRLEPTFHLLLGTEVTDLLREADRVVGVLCGPPGDPRRLAADVVVDCSGRGSPVRARAGLVPRTFGVPMDVMWFRLPRVDGDPVGGTGRVSRSRILVLIDRGDYFQVGLVIRKGRDPELRAEGIEAFRRSLREALPWLGDRVEALTSFEDVQLLRVELARLRRWFAAGMLCIGDAAHAMSPVGGVGINLAVQDAVATARILAPSLLRHGPVPTHVLARVQLRRWLPTALTQLGQRAAHRAVIGPQLAPDARSSGRGIALFRRLPILRRVSAHLVAIGLLPEHAPRFARRPTLRLETTQRDGLGGPGQNQCHIV
jgi:2-polyprenyl-6-methoxyphenol hydroxylase-like FAD-dependent oxidoreductase